MSAIRCPMWIFCCSIRWISSPCWLSKWMGLAFMRPGASRQGGIKNSILEKCAVPFLRLRTDGSGEKGKIQTALKEDRLCRKLSGTRSDARNVETLLKARLSMISMFAAGSCAVDGGLDYLRRCGNLGDWEELSKVEKVEGNNALT